MTQTISHSMSHIQRFEKFENLENLNIRVWTELTRGSELFPNHWIVIDKWIKNNSLSSTSNSSLKRFHYKVPILCLITVRSKNTTKKIQTSGMSETVGWRKTLLVAFKLGDNALRIKFYSLELFRYTVSMIYRV